MNIQGNNHSNFLLDFLCTCFWTHEIYSNGLHNSEQKTLTKRAIGSIPGKTSSFSLFNWILLTYSCLGDLSHHEILTKLHPRIDKKSWVNLRKLLGSETSRGDASNITDSWHTLTFDESAEKISRPPTHTVKDKPLNLSLRCCQI